MWHLAEFVPKLVYDPVAKRQRLGLGLGRHRFIHDGALLDKSVLERIRGTAYTPANMTSSFIASVKALTFVPDTLSDQAAAESP